MKFGYTGVTRGALGLNCSVDIRGASGASEPPNELLYVIKLFSGYQGSERGE